MLGTKIQVSAALFFNNLFNLSLTTYHTTIFIKYAEDSPFLPIFVPSDAPVALTAIGRIGWTTAAQMR